MVVYLAGAINGCTDAEAADWRELVKEMLEAKGFQHLDPMRRDYRGRELEPGIAQEIVAGDVEDITRCDIVLANCPKPSWGTAMEIRLAWAEHTLPVIAVLPEGVTPSPWLIQHTTAIVHSYQDAVAAIEAEAQLS